jgi:hypothetical protein
MYTTLGRYPTGGVYTCPISTIVHVVRPLSLISIRNVSVASPMIQQRNKRPSLLSASSSTQQRPLLAGKPSGPGSKPSPGAVKTQRTSKTSQKLVVLPSAPQTKPLPEEDDHGYETDAGVIKERKNEGERMGKEQRKKAGFNRLTAYCVAESFNMKLLASFLRREHNVVPRVFDNALYTVSRRKLFLFAPRPI